MKVVVTGGKGLLGRAVMKVLEQTFHMAVSFDLVDGQDILNRKQVKEALKDADAVVHTAAQISVPQSFKDPQATYEANLLGTTNLAHAFHGKRFIYISSASVYGRPGFCAAWDGTSPKSPYAVSKLAAEMAAWAYSRLNKFECITIRPNSMYGPGMKGFLQTIINHAQTGEPITIYGHGNLHRSYVHVEDVAQAIYQCLIQDGLDNLYLLGGQPEDYITINDIVGRIREWTGNKAPVEHIAPPVGDFQEEYPTLDILPAHLALDFNPRSFEEGVKPFLFASPSFGPVTKPSGTAP